MRASGPAPTNKHPEPARTRFAWLGFGSVAAILVIGGLWAGGEWGRSTALRTLTAQARTDADIKVALLRAVLERPRALPLVLAEDSELRSALVTRSEGGIARLNRKLENLVAGTQAAVIYVIGRDGVAIASSNWREPLSFVGNDYSFREYFRKAVSDGGAEHYALGSVSKRPGLYISRRVEGFSDASSADGDGVGVVVVKVEFDQLEADWNQAGAPTYVIDPQGIVLITSIPSWRFMAVQPIAAERLTGIRESLQFGDAPLAALPFKPVETPGPGSEIIRALMPGGTGSTELLRLDVPVPSTAWRLQHLVPVARVVVAAVREARITVMAALLPLLALAAFLLRRRQVALHRIVAARLAREELELRVAERTRDLSVARDKLQAEIAGHRTTESKLQTVQQDLIQANRLAILGQVAAGVAHEINQPVATIRAYADNACTFLDRDQPLPAAENMRSIAALTERIGTITDELKAFARKGRAGAEPTVLRDVIEGAVLLLRSRFSGRMDALDIALPPAATKVMGTRIRLEQVMINLLQNALEAISGREEGRVEVRVEDAAGTIVLTVADNGPGIAPDILQALFTPFNTSKEGGLGLGLVISKEILADYGGRIDVASSGSGTRFTLHLKKA